VFRLANLLKFGLTVKPACAFARAGDYPV